MGGVQYFAISGMPGGSKYAVWLQNAKIRWSELGRQECVCAVWFKRRLLEFIFFDLFTLFFHWRFLCQYNISGPGRGFLINAILCMQIVYFFFRAPVRAIFIIFIYCFHRHICKIWISWAQFLLLDAKFRALFSLVLILLSPIFLHSPLNCGSRNISNKDEQCRQDHVIA